MCFLEAIHKATSKNAFGMDFQSMDMEQGKNSRRFLNVNRIKPHPRYLWVYYAR